jgi:hypothetical protein
MHPPTESQGPLYRSIMNIVRVGKTEIEGVRDVRGHVVCIWPRPCTCRVRMVVQVLHAVWSTYCQTLHPGVAEHAPRQSSGPMRPSCDHASCVHVWLSTDSVTEKGVDGEVHEL